MEWIFFNVLAASATACCAASSQPFGRIGHHFNYFDNCHNGLFTGKKKGCTRKQTG
jgi:hypothetical protein